MAGKSDLVQKVISKMAGLPPADIKKAVDLTLDYLQAELAARGRIEIRGFGSFSTRDRKAVGSNKTYKTVYFRGTKYDNF